MDNLPNGQRLGHHYYRLLPKFKGTAFGPFIISNLVIWTSFGHPDQRQIGSNTRIFIQDEYSVIGVNWVPKLG